MKETVQETHLLAAQAEIIMLGVGVGLGGVYILISCPQIELLLSPGWRPGTQLVFFPPFQQNFTTLYILHTLLSDWM